MFSTRTRWNLTANRLSSILEEKRRSGRTIIDLTEANPTRVGIPYAKDILAPLSDPGALTYEPTPFGLLSAREAVERDYARRGFPLGAERILLTASTSEAYSFLFKLLCDPEDHVLAPRPSYPLFEYLASLESVVVDHYPLDYHGGWRLDVSAVSQALSPQSRAVIVVNPNNPTGSFLKRDEASRLSALCASQGVALISDEVFADYAFEEDPSRLESLAGNEPALTFTLGGLSKSCGLPQIKIGWVGVSGPPGLRSEALARLEIIADTYLSVGTPAQRATPDLLARLPALQAPIRARVLENLETLRKSLRPGSPVTLLTVEGGWFAVLQIPSTLSEEDWTTRLLIDEDLLVHPGYFFDFPREAFVVLSLLSSPPSFGEGIDRMLRRVEGAGGGDVL